MSAKKTARKRMEAPVGEADLEEKKELGEACAPSGCKDCLSAFAVSSVRALFTISPPHAGDLFVFFKGILPEFEAKFLEEVVRTSSGESSL